MALSVSALFSFWTYQKKCLHFHFIILPDPIWFINVSSNQKMVSFEAKIMNVFPSFAVFQIIWKIMAIFLVLSPNFLFSGPLPSTFDVLITIQLVSLCETNVICCCSFCLSTMKYALNIEISPSSWKSSIPAMHKRM